MIKLLRLTLLLCALIVGSGTSWAVVYKSFTDETEQASATISGSNVSSGTVGEISWSGTSCTYASSRVNIAANGSITFTASSGNNITKIVMVTGTTAAYVGTWSSNEGTPTTSTDGKTVTIDGISANSVTITTSSAYRCTSAGYIEIHYESSGGGGGSSLEDNDLALTGASVELDFDLYNNSTAQVINYTTSSTGAVTIADNEFIDTEIDQDNKTITVTPKAVTPSAQTITVNQAADDNYKAGSTTFTVTITDSTPFTGGDVTFDATKDSGASPLTKQVVTFSCSSGALNNGSEYRLYKNSITTFSLSDDAISDGYKITCITFTGVNGNPASGFASQDGWTTDGYNGTWTGEETSVSFTASTAQVRATKIVVTVEKPAAKVLSSISLSGTYPTTFHTGDTFSHEGMTVTANYEGGTTKDVTADATFTGYDMSSTGEQTVTVSYTENSTTKTATYNITVNAPATLSSITLSGTYPTEFEQGDEFSSEGIVVTANWDDLTTSDVTADATFTGYDMSNSGEQTVTVSYEGKTATYNITIVEKKGTATNPYTVAEAIAYINTLGSSTSADEVYVSGIISQVDSYNSTYKSITYWISDDGTTTGQMEVYSGKGLNGAAFSAVTDLAVGDIVTVKGKVKMFNTTPEFDKNNELVSIQKPIVAVTGVSLDIDAVTLNPGATQQLTATVAPANATNKNVTWESSDPTVATVSDEGLVTAVATGSATITVTTEDGGKTATCEVTVNAVPQHNATFSINGVESDPVPVYVGADIQFPEVESIGGYTFQGWRTATLDLTDTDPDDYVTEATMGTSDVTYYAVFAKVGHESGTVEDVLDNAFTGVSGTSYSEWSDKAGSASSAVYAGQSAGGNESIQLRSNNSNSGIVSTTSGGKLKKVVVEWNTNTDDARILQIWGSNTAYTSPTELYGNTAVGESVAEIQKGTTEYTFTDAYAYIGLRSKSGAMYLDKITITWESNVENKTDFCTSIPVPAEVKIIAAANATWVAPANVKVGTQAKVYTVTYDGNTAQRHEITDKIVPVNAAVLLTSDGETNVTVTPTNDEAKDYAALQNHLKASDGTVHGGDNIYALAKIGNELGFYQVASSIYVPAGKAYLEITVPDPSDAPARIWFDGETTAIDSLNGETGVENDGAVYDLSGRRVNGTLSHGLYIKNGKKFIVK